uniref:Uncharacterized protein n=1 Tax=Salix viminalis TaxID=40686 RepID=A0A6N2MBX6_SALVM
MSESHSRRRLSVFRYCKKPHAPSESSVSAKTDGASRNTPTLCLTISTLPASIFSYPVDPSPPQRRSASGVACTHDTHYLLHIYDLMRDLLLSKPNDNENADPPLLEVYKRNYDVCMQLYEKELFTENSYLNMYGLPSAGFNAQQLAIVAVSSCLFQGDAVTSSQLHRLMKSKHSYIERHLSSAVSIIRHSMQTSAAFEATVQHLKERYMETKALQEETEVNNGSEAQSIHGGNGMNNNVAACHETSRSGVVELGRGGQGSSAKHHGENGEVNTGFSSCISDTSPTAKVAGATVEVLKEPSKAGKYSSDFSSDSSVKTMLPQAEMEAKNADLLRHDEKEKIEEAVSPPGTERSIETLLFLPWHPTVKFLCIEHLPFDEQAPDKIINSTVNRQLDGLNRKSIEILDLNDTWRRTSSIPCPFSVGPLNTGNGLPIPSMGISCT